VLDPHKPRTIGRRLAKLRAECGVTREHLAQAGGIGFHTLRRIETGLRGLQADEFIAIVQVFERIPRITPHLIDELRQVRDLLHRLVTEAES
jgi:transcriptional regulator with XRE-family HTH domain